MTITTLKVDGMTCSACTASIENAFKEVDGAEQVAVSLIMGQAVIHHNPIKLSPERVAEMIEDRGFDVRILSTGDANEDGAHDFKKSPVSVTTLAVEGMTCGACTAAVQKGLEGLPGITSISVSLLSERCVVEHDASVITPGKISGIIEDCGFGATVLNTQTPSSTLGTSGSKNEVENGRRLLSTTVAIEGMTCGACTASITNAFADVQGLFQFDISLLAERAVLIHDPAVLPSEKIVGIIEDAGFDARVITSQESSTHSHFSRSINLSLYGLPNPDSALSLQDALQRKSGVNSVSIDFPTSRASIVYDSAMVGIRSIVEIIEAAGYNALVSDSEDTNAQLESLAKTREVQEWRRAFRFSLCFAIPVFLMNMIIPMCIPTLDFGKLRLFPGLYLGDVICLILTIPVQFGVGKRFYISSYKSLKHRAPTMDVLVMLGTSAAFFYSIFTILVSIFSEPHLRPSTVFDTSTMLITFITLGRWLENRAKGETSKALSQLMSLTPSMATIYNDPIAAQKVAEEWDASVKEATSRAAPAGISGQKTIPTDLLQVGDVVVLRPGDKVSADGIVVRGESFVNESMVTGEALPIHKKKGNSVIAGTVNGSGSMDFKVTRAGRDTQLSQIVKLVQNAQTSRAPIQRMVDVVAGYFVPVIITLGLLTFTVWMVLSHTMPSPPSIFLVKGNGGKVMVCLKLCISVIVFACPCALGLSTPTAVMVGTGVGAQHGILIKGGIVLEAATKINHVVFDKTGTLTEGKMSVSEVRLEPIWTSNEWRRRLWWLIVGLAEMNSEHPVGKAIAVAAKAETGNSGESTLDGAVGNFEAVPGKGISAVVEPASGIERTRYRVLIGNATFLRSGEVKLPESADPSAQPPDESASMLSDLSKHHDLEPLTLVHVAIDGQYAGTISLRDALKCTAVGAIAALHRMGISTSLVTGDTYPAALAVSNAVGIPATSIYASVSPSNKQSVVSSFQSSGDHVAVVGDGINDSPALATASVGIALASGADVAMEAADIVLIRSDDLLGVPASLLLCRTILNRIKLNLIWACLYNAIGLPFAMGVFLPFGGISLHPMAAGAAMAASSVSVVVSSLLLKFWHRPRWMDLGRLEKEVALGKISQEGNKSRWWKKSPFADDAARDSFGPFTHLRTTMAALLSIRGGRTDEGYIPLQAVEPAV